MTDAKLRPASRIVVGVDGTLESRHAVAWAVDHARPGDTIVLIHAWRRSPAAVESSIDPIDQATAARNFVDREVGHAKQLARGADLTIIGVPIEGSAASALVAGRADAVVIGGSRHSWLTRAILHPLAARLVRDARLPAVIVPIRKGT